MILKVRWSYISISLALDHLPPGPFNTNSKSVHFQAKSSWVPVGFDDSVIFLDDPLITKAFFQIKLNINFSDKKN